MKLENEQQILLLSKMIGYIKFKSEEDESFFLANSPVINELFDKVYEAYLKHIPSSEEMSIKAVPHIQQNIMIKLSNVHNWKNLDDSVKDETIKTLAYPYKVDDGKLNEMKLKADEMYSV